MIDLRDSVAVVTGANRGLGHQFASQLLERGAAKVYAAARDPQRVDLPGVVPLQLDITDPGPSPGPRRRPPTPRCSSTTPASGPTRG